jgi:uncharacterized protein (TIGR02271 family)
MGSETDFRSGYHGQIQAGWTVYGSDGKKIGNVAAGDSQAQARYFVLEKGMFFPTEHYIPFSAIDSIDDDEIRLNVTKDQIESNRWDQPPTASDDDMDMGEAVTGYQQRAGTTPDGGTLERQEEHLRVDKQPVKTGEVRVGKRVVEEEQAVDVPVTREEVQVRRRSVDRPASGASTQGETIVIPVTEERATATKDARVVEEIEIDKVARQETQRVGDTVKKEEFEIEGDDETRRP